MASNQEEMKGYALRLPLPVYNRVKNLAFFTDRSMNELMVAAITEFLDKAGDAQALEAITDRVRSEHRILLDKLRDV